MKINPGFFSLIASTLWLSLLAGCDPAPTAATGDPVATIVSSTQTAIAALPSPTPQPPTPLPASPSPQPSATSMPTPTAAPTQTPTPTPIPCTNQAALVSESFSGPYAALPGERFSKRWELQNTGTCPWGEGYSLVLDGGYGLGADTIPITQTVAAGANITLSYSFLAPEALGGYTGEWKLRSPEGVIFGLVSASEHESLVVEVQVSDDQAAPALGTPTYTDSFDSNQGAWYLSADENVEFKIDQGNLVLTAFQAAGDQWRLFGGSAPADLYLEVTYTTGKACSGKDSYGLMVRAPTRGEAAYTTGYVFGVSCDGQYRLYSMNSGAFQTLINWASSDLLHPGPEQTNTLSMWAKGSDLKLYINRRLLTASSDSNLTGGSFGLVIRSKDTPGFQVNVEELKYWELR